MTFEDALAIYRQRLQGDASLKPRTKAHREERINTILKTWPALARMDVRKVSKHDCLAWAMKVYGHLRDQHSSSMAQRVSFDAGPRADNIVSLPESQVG